MVNIAITFIGQNQLCISTGPFPMENPMLKNPHAGWHLPGRPGRLGRRPGASSHSLLLKMAHLEKFIVDIPTKWPIYSGYVWIYLLKVVIFHGKL